MTAEGLRVLVADEDEAALDRLTTLLHEFGRAVPAYAVDVSDVAEKVVADDPELSMVVLHHDDDHALALIEEICAYAWRIDEHADAGEGSRVRRQRGRSRHRRARQAGRAGRRAERDRGRAASPRGDRAPGGEGRRPARGRARAARVIERAKGILMERHGVDDRTAFKRLRTHARTERRRVVDIAIAVADGELELP